MNNEFDNFSNIIDNIIIEREKVKFEIHQLKIEHYYWNSGDMDVFMPISTSIELTSKYNFETGKLNWKKNISHTYLNNYNEKSIKNFSEILDNSEQLINELEKNDLRNLQNNYFSDKDPERFTHWELTYNNYFKIVGTYDQEIEEFLTISDKLNFKKVIQEVIKKPQDRINYSEINGDYTWNC